MDNPRDSFPEHSAVQLGAAVFSVGKTLDCFGGRAEWDGRLGGYFCLADNLGAPRHIMRIRSVPEAKADKYLLLCQEKAQRLARHPEHQTSFESRRPDTYLPRQPRGKPWGEWGGAVRFENYIFAFSGLPEQGDEVAMMGICFLLSSWTERRIREIQRLKVIAERNRNTALWYELLPKL